MTAITRITKITLGHVGMVDAAGLAVAKGSTFVDMAGTPAEALAAWNDAKATVVKTRGEANAHGTVRRKLETLVAAFDAPAEDLPGIGAAVSADQLAARRAAKANAEPVVTDADAEAVMVADADDHAIAVAVDEVAKGLVEQAKKSRKPRAAKAPKKAAPAATKPGRPGKGLKEQTLAWHMANPTTPAKAEELKVIFGAKWAGPIRIHQRNLVDAGFLVQVGEPKPETYMFKAGSESTETE